MLHPDLKLCPFIVSSQPSAHNISIEKLCNVWASICDKKEFQPVTKFHIDSHKLIYWTMKFHQSNTKVQCSLSESYIDIVNQYWKHISAENVVNHLKSIFLQYCLIAWIS